MFKFKGVDSMRQRGFTAIEAVVIVAIVLVLGLGGWYVFSKNQKKQNNTSSSESSESSDVTWNFNNGKTWQASGTPPSCPDPLVFPVSPIDTKPVTSLLFPGQYRGTDYKPHGGFRFGGSKSTDVTVRVPMDAQLTGLTRYFQDGELQYLLSFMSPCGIMYRFDHLFTLSDQLQAIAEKTPAPKEGDTRGLTLENGPKLHAGDVVATAIGFPKQGNIFFDFGVYDLRSPNQISHNSEWAALQANEKEQEYYGICWFDMLPEPDKTTVNNLAKLQADKGDPSDYCSVAKRTTLD
jgi:type II secretory pathway pseudopilin PulG